ncbi:unnamed protein product [Cylicostephanus goldi]|uniref:Uncharacterized protein n=1 Tax=Cylicostephanus goldi TaxID=71465 RepID=A0A3P6RKP3_CYLGO|nr:unnamed protein product [Cylicostephanus goldi]
MNKYDQISFYPPRIATGLLTLLVMRVIYIIKALQIIVAVVVLFRLINIGKFCENRRVHSRGECLGTMKLAIPPLNTDLSLRDAERSLKTGAEPDRHRRMSVVSDCMIVITDEICEGFIQVAV